MPTYQQKVTVKSYKLKIKNKHKCVVEGTEEVVTKLRSCVSVFDQRLEELLTSDDERFLSEYQKLGADFEKHQEKLFYLLASLDGTTTDDDNEPAASEESCGIHPVVSPAQPSEQPSTLKDPSIAFESQTSISSSSYLSLQDYSRTSRPQWAKYEEKDRSITDAEFTIHLRRDEPGPDLKETEKSVSQNSCYRSPSSSCDQSSISSNLPLESSVSENTEVKLLESCHPWSHSQFTQRISFSPVVPLNSVISATLTHIINPSDFWMQFKNSSGYEISFPLSQFIDKNPPQYVQEGDFCLAPFKSLPYYYRAKCLNEALGSEEVEVFFIDYGSSQKISLINLRPLPRSSYEIPIQAFHCELYNIAPTKGVWSSVSIEKLREFQNNSIETHVKSFSCDKYTVQLFATVSASFCDVYSCDIAQALCLDGYASGDMAPNSIQECRSADNSNQTSCDSGVSVTFNQRTSPVTENLPLESDWTEGRETLFVDRNSSCFRPPNFDLPPHRTSYFVTESKQNLNGFASAEREPDPAMKYLSVAQYDHCVLLKRCSKTPDCDCALHLTIPPPLVTFVEKNMMLVMVSHIVDPNEFYVNLAMENSLNLDELREQMTTLYESQLDSLSMSSDDLKVGMFCAARYEEDRDWYRVVVLKIYPEDDSSCDVLVQYVDYGNETLIKQNQMRPLLPRFAQHPSLSIKCSLSGISPIHNDDNNGSKGWSKEAVDAFRKMISFDRCLTAQICESRNPLHTLIPVSSSPVRPVEVLLWDTKETADVLINDALIQMNLAQIDSDFVNEIQLDNAKLSKEKTVLHYWDPMYEEFNSVENSYGVHAEDGEVAISGYKQNDESYACKYFSLRGHCPRGDRCQFQHIPLAAGGVTRDQEEIFSVDVPPSLPNPSCNVVMQVSAVVSPGLFYSILPFGSISVDEIDSLVHRGAPRESIRGYKDEIKELYSAMDEHYQNSPFAENTGVALAFGSIVAAWRKVENAWRRARIIDVSDIAGPSRVFFVDFGDEALVSRKNIRTILPEYLHTPFQAIECHLSDVEPLGFEKGKNWSLSALNRFKELVSNEALLAHVTYRCGKILHVTLRKTSALDHDSISEILVREGFAQHQKIKTSALTESVYVPG